MSTDYSTYTAIIWLETVNRLAIFGEEAAHCTRTQSLRYQATTSGEARSVLDSIRRVLTIK
jgi:hypothetical protein